MNRFKYTQKKHTTLIKQYRIIYTFELEKDVMTARVKKGYSEYSINKGTTLLYYSMWTKTWPSGR